MISKRDLAGKAGEYRVLSELLSRGILASPYLIDDGSDLVLNNGKRIQVKSRQAYTTNTHIGGFQIVFASQAWDKQTKKRITIENPLYDYLIVWGWGKDKDYFYIFPKEALSGLKSAYLNPDKGTPANLHKYLGKWDILQD